VILPERSAGARAALVGADAGARAALVGADAVGFLENILGTDSAGGPVLASLNPSNICFISCILGVTIVPFGIYYIGYFIIKINPLPTCAKVRYTPSVYLTLAHVDVSDVSRI
jgi:hypothetical protein